MTENYAYSTNEENYNGIFNSREEAIIECGQAGWTGRVVQKSYDDYVIDAYRIIEHAQEMAWDEAGEFADGYLEGITKEQRELIDSELPSLIYDLFKKHGVDLSPCFFTVTDVIAHESPTILTSKEYEYVERRREGK